jgi:ribonuclease P protein component
MYTLGSNKRLKSRKQIQEVMSKGIKLKEGALLLLYLPSNEETTRIAVSALKRNFKRAVDRNTIKRLMREAYRLNQNLVPEQAAYYLFFVYLGKDIQNFDYFNTKIKQALMRLINTSTQHEEEN